MRLELDTIKTSVTMRRKRLKFLLTEVRSETGKYYSNEQQIVAEVDKAVSEIRVKNASPAIDKIMLV